MPVLTRRAKKAEDARIAAQASLAVVLDNTLLAHASNSYHVPTPEEVERSNDLIQRLQGLSLDATRAPQPTSQDVEQHITVHKSYVSALRRLSPELLIRIFALASEWDPASLAWNTESKWWTGHRSLHFSWLDDLPQKDSVGFARYSQFESAIQGFGCPSFSPWSVSAVCKRWRDIAIASPELWSDILLYINQKTEPKKSPVFTRLSIALRRSESLGLNITILLRTNIPASIVTALKQQSHRWERLAIRCSLGAGIGKLLDGPEFPQLRGIVSTGGHFPPKAKLPMLDTWYDLTNHVTSGLAGQAGHLHHVAGYIIFREPEDENIFTQLKGFSQLPGLQTLKVIVNADAKLIQDEPLQQGQLQFPNLASLSLGSTPGHALPLTLDMLSAPALEKLHLSSLAATYPLLSLIERSRCSLTCLTIHEAGLNSLDLHDILDSAPRLERLHIKFSTSTRKPHPEIGRVHDTVLHRLFGDGNGRPTATHLRTASLLNTIELNVELVVDLLRDNQAVAQRFEAVTLGLFGQELEARAGDIAVIRKRSACVITLCPWDSSFDDSDVDVETDAELSDSDAESSECSWDESKNAKDMSRWVGRNLLDMDLEGPDSSDESDEYSDQSGNSFHSSQAGSDDDMF